MSNDLIIRNGERSDHAAVISVMNDWWGGRNLIERQLELFFVHFRDTTLVAERNGSLVGFLNGFLSQTFEREAYIHFVGVRPDERRSGLGRALYERFFDVCRERGRTVVRCCTSPVNRGSIAFHRRMGFVVEPGDGEIDGVPVTLDYDSRGTAKVRFTKILADE